MNVSGEFAHLGPQEPLEENIATGLSRDSFHLIEPF